MSRSLAGRLGAEGFEAHHVTDTGIRGQSDDLILEHARQHSLVLITADVGFGNLLRFPLGTHSGIVVARFPNELSTKQLNDSIVAALRNVSANELDGSLLIIEPGKIRLRRRS